MTLKNKETGIILFLVVLMLIFFASVARCQNTATSGTVSDTDGQTWNNGTWQATFTPSPSHPNLGDYNINGVPLNPALLLRNGSLDGAGLFTVSIYSNTAVSPAGSTWVFQFCPYASAPCYNTPPTTITGASQSINSVSTGIPPVRFPAMASAPFAYGYADGEVSQNPKPGGQYFNVTLNASRYWNGTAWVAYASSGGTVVNSINTVPGAFTFNGTGVSCVGTTCTFTGGTSVGTSAKYNTAYYDSTTTVNGTPLGMPLSAWGVVVNDQSTQTKLTNTMNYQAALDWAWDTYFCTGIGACYSIMPLAIPSGSIYLGGPLAYRAEPMYGQSEFNTSIWGAPGQDVFAAPDRSDLGLTSGTYVSGGTITGTAGQTCVLSNFYLEAGAKATVTLTGTNTIASGTAFTVNNIGGGAPVPPTTASLTNGTATCSGTATVTAVNSTTITRRCCMAQTHTHDFMVLVDSTVDANTTGTLAQQAAWAAKGRGLLAGSVFANYLTNWSSYTSGWVGQTSAGSAIGAGTISLNTAISPTTNFHIGVANIGWVKDSVTGEFMTYRGIGTVGCPGGKPACLLNVVHQVTLAGIASPADTGTSNTDPIQPINPLAPANTTDWIPANTVGACGMSFPTRVGGTGQGVPFQHGALDHVYFGTHDSSGFQFNNTCGIYFQGSLYGSSYKDIYMNQITYGIVNSPSFTNTDAAQQAHVSSDDVIFDHLDINAFVPFVSWLSGLSEMNAATFYANGNTALQSKGMTLYSNPCHSYASGCGDSEQYGWTITSFYQEWNDNGSNGAYGGVFPPMAQIGGYSDTFNCCFMNAGANPPLVWDAWLADTNNFTLGNVLIYGNNNKLDGGNSITTVNDQGYDNTVFARKPTNGLRGMYMSPTRGKFNNLKPDMFLLGAVNGDWFQSLENLFYTPEDLNNVGGSGSTGGPVINDASVPITHRYITIPSPGTLGTVNLNGNTGIWGTAIGQRFPKGKGVGYIALRADIPTTQTWRIACQSGPVGSLPLNITTTWTIFSIPYDSTGGACPVGGNGGFFDSPGGASPASNIYVGYEAIVPNFDLLNVTGPINAGSVVTPSLTATTASIGTLNVSGLITASGGIAGLAPLTLLPPLTTQTGLTIDTQPIPSAAPLIVKVNGVAKFNVTNAGDLQLTNTTPSIFSNTGFLRADNFAGWQSSNAFTVGDFLQVASYIRQGGDAYSTRLAAGQLQIGSQWNFAPANGALRTFVHIGSFLDLSQVTAAGATTATLTGAAGGVTTDYYACYFDIYGVSAGCSTPAHVTNAPTTPTGSNFYQIQSPANATTFYVRVCRQGGYATSGYINAQTQGQSVNMNDTTGSTFLPGDGTVCSSLSNISDAGFRMTAMTDPPGQAGKLLQWSDSAFRPAFNDNNTGKKLNAGVLASAPITAGHFVKKAANGIDDVDGGTGTTATLPSATDVKDTVQTDSGGTPTILTSATSGTWEAVQNGGADNTGSVDASSIINAELTTLCATSTPARIHLAAGTYKINSGLLMSGTSTTCKGIVIEGDGSNNTILQTTCAGQPYGIWYNNTTNSGEHFNGPTFRHLQIKGTGGTACQVGVQLTQTAGFQIDDLLVTGFSGQTYATGTIATSGTTVTGSGTTFNANMVHGILEVSSGNNTARAEICAFGSTTSLTLCSNAFPTGNVTAGTAYAIAYGGDGIVFDGGFSWTQYGTVKDTYVSGNLIGYHGWGSNSGGASRIQIVGRRSYTSPNPGGRIADGIGIYYGKGSDTLTWQGATNNETACVVLESSHGNRIEGECENSGTYAAVTTCNGGTASQACTVAFEANSDTNGHGWTNLFSGYAYLWGNVYQFDNTTGAFGASIMNPRDLSGQYTNHYVFNGTSACPSTGNGVTIIAYDCFVHF